MDLRQKFEGMEKQKTSLSQELESLVKDEEQGYTRYSSWQCGGLLGISVIDTHQYGDLEAFVLGKSYGVPSAGVESSVDFGVIKGEHAYRGGFKMTRGGRAQDIDDPHGTYSEVKIIETKEDEALIGLRSHAALDFYKIDFKKGRIEKIQRYDLKKEQIDKEKKDLEEKAQQTEDFGEKLKTFGERLRKEFPRTEETAYKIIEVGGRKIGVIAIETYDRDCDASIEDVHFYVLEQGSKEPVKVLTRRPQFDKSYKYHEKFFQVYARKEISDQVSEESGKIKIPIKLTIRGSWNCGYPGRQSSSTLKEDSFELEYKLKE